MMTSIVFDARNVREQFQDDVRGFARRSSEGPAMMARQSRGAVHPFATVSY
jgi:hypothetical protein